MKIIGCGAERFGSGNIAQHNRRDKIPDYAIERPGLPRVVELYQDREHAEDVLELVKAQPRRRGRQPGVGIELIIAGPPPYDPIGWTGPRRQWTEQQVHDFGRDAFEWVHDAVGRDPETAVATISEAHIHQDERAPHAHVTLIPATRRNPRPSKLALEYALAGVEPPEDLRSKFPKNLRRTILDRFLKDVGAKHGLSRGRVGGHALPQPMDHIKGLSDRARDAEEASAYAAGQLEESRAENKVLADEKAESDRRAAEAERRAAEDRAAHGVLEQEARTERNERNAAEVRLRYSEKEKAAIEASRDEAKLAKSVADDLVAAYGQANRENREELRDYKRRFAAAEAARPEEEPAPSRHPVRAKRAGERALGRARGRIEQDRAVREAERRQAEKKPRRTPAARVPAPERAPDLRGGLRSGQTGGAFVPQGGRRGRGR